MILSDSCNGQESFIFQRRYGPGLTIVPGTALFKAAACLLFGPLGPVDGGPPASARPFVSANARIVNYKDLGLPSLDLGRARLMCVMVTSAG